MEMGLDGAIAQTKSRCRIVLAEVSEVAQLDGLALTSRQLSQRSGQSETGRDDVLEDV
jgi:hypothetical protein